MSNNPPPPSFDRDSSHDVSNFQTIAARIRQLRDIISEMDEDRSFFLHALDRSLQEYNTADSTVNPQAISNSNSISTSNSTSNSNSSLEPLPTLSQTLQRHVISQREARRQARMAPQQQQQQLLQQQHLLQQQQLQLQQQLQPPPPPPPPPRPPQQRQESLASLASLQRAERQFRQAIASIGAAETTSRQPERPPARSPPTDSMSDHRQSKRRKIDADDSRDTTKGFSYSHYGQVTPVPLEMEVHSCKGGSSEPDRRGNNSPDHILVNDGVVYRAQGGFCNIVLRHRGEIPFSLKKLIIKTPKSGCHDEMNVREGTVSISMDSDPRFLRSVASCSADSMPGFPSRRPRRRNEQLSPFAAATAAVAPMGNSRRPETSASILRSRMLRSRAGQQQQQLHQQQLLLPDSQFGIVDDPEDKSEDESTQHDAARDQLTISDPEPSNSRDSSPNHDGSDSESSDGISGVAEALAQNLDTRQRQLLEALGVRVPYMQARPSHRHRALSPTTVFARPAAEALHSQESETMQPVARFSIEHERAAVQIRFNPPVSARYILIKMWAPFNPGRMDIESIIAHGFAGPRFFPAQEPR
ncbi:hypothetical protein MGYG_03751 [Nannizzia gypsea CBS 118893]|uniref:Uncharacterized protein n=1 Tax=Arthroderma gypseum (strain ATCC MYA-4604 / CBS 118893) TaxID=535722 RepID=E4UTN7_ARTGP|nr:hypothetical protein MGYG_03751 [Nannizzia gypsea CBS 118893]EFR00746.1 hypothetical protein MGYG_03751 [Nannizzia gypsea CBS 118893]